MTLSEHKGALALAGCLSARPGLPGYQLLLPASNICMPGAQDISPSAPIYRVFPAFPPFSPETLRKGLRRSAWEQNASIKGGYES